MIERSAAVAAATLVAALWLAPTAAAATCPERDASDPPCLTLSPSSGPVGTRVEITGRVTDDLDLWQKYFRNPSYFSLITHPDFPPTCELIVDAEEGRVRAAADGTVTGSFVVGSEGGCFQQDGTMYPAPPGQYVLSIGCHACNVAEFRITGLPLTGGQAVPMAAAGLAAVVAGTALVWLGYRRESA